MTMTALKAHPKVYWIWNHRRWCLENIPDVPESDPDDNTWKKEAWDRELFVVEKMLDSDPRNCMFLICSLYNVYPSTLTSSRVGLPKIHPCEHANSSTTSVRASLHITKNRVQLFKLQCMAPAIQGIVLPLGEWRSG